MSGTVEREPTLRAVSAAATLALAALAFWGAVEAQDGSHPGSGDIRAGSCADPGDVVALLEPIAGDIVPMGQAPAVISGITEVSLAFAELTGEPHIISVGSPDAASGVLCGAISGPLVAGPGLATALANEEGAVVGIAWLRELGLEATTVHVFLVAEAMESIGHAPVPDASPSPGHSPSPTPSGSPVAEGEVPPEGELDPGEDIDVDVAD